MNYLIVIDNGIEAENYYFVNKEDALKKFNEYKKYLTLNVELYKIEKLK